MELCSHPAKDSHRSLKVFVFPKQIILCEPPPTPEAPSLSLAISRGDRKIREQSCQEKWYYEQLNLVEVKECYVFAGSIHLKQQEFLIFVTEAKVVGSIGGNATLEITKIDWLNRSQTHHIDEEVEELKELMTDLIEGGGYYFSRTLDLSMSRQLKQSRPQFIWNSFLLSELRRWKVGREWMVHIIQGFIGFVSFEFIYKPKIVYILISRRSCKRAGTRFYTRGIDDEGEVANYVETEQLIYAGPDVVSHVQVRGSVPLFWEQRGIDGIQSTLAMTRTLQTSQSAFVRHLQQLKESYKRCFIINLLNDSKVSEGHLTSKFEEMIALSGNVIHDFVRYEYFNFHEKCGSSHFENCNPLIDKLQPVIESFQYFHARGGQVLSTQEGVVRSNCLDCLDRTNFIQAKVAITILENVLRQLDFNFDLNLRENMDQVDCLKMVKEFKSLWADNGDMISIHYTGMPSTHTDITRKGKRTFLGMIGHKIKSLGRFYKQFTDITKQDTINLLLGYTTYEGSNTQRLEKEVKLRKNEYSKLTPLSLMVVSWNVSFTNCPRRFISKISHSLKELPNLLVIGLQNVYECSKLVEGNEMVVDYIKNSWKKLLETELVNECGYSIVSEKFAHGSGLYIFFRASKDVHLWDFGGLSTTEINFSGVLDRTSEAIMLTRLKVQDTSFVFGNFNFEKGTDILQQAGQIHEDAFQHVELGRQKEEKILNIDYRVLFGHLGNSIVTSGDKIKGLLKKYQLLKGQGDVDEASNVLVKLLQHDIMIKNKDTHPYLNNYNEGPITFLPTSSYITLDQYDQQRFPSWSSRIFMCAAGESIVKQHIYHPVYEIGGQHLPVISVYTVDVAKEDAARKRQVETECGNIRQ